MTHRIVFALVMWLACACALAGVPERPRFRVVGTAQGLPSTDIKALVRDADGYLWIGTADGLARYDGVDMRVWRYDPARPDGLPGNNVQALLVDAGNRLWVAVEGEGVSVLDARRQRFTRYRKATHPALGSDDVWAMARQGDAVWLGMFEGGLARVDASGRMRRYAQADGLPSDTVLALAVDAQGTLWAGTTDGLARLRGDAFEPVALPGAEDAPLVYSLVVQDDGLWVGSALGVWRNRDGHWSQPEWSPMFHRPNAMMAIASDRDGGHWIASQRGLWRQQGRDVPVPVRAGGPDIPRALSALLRQPDGALWVPLAGIGLGYLHSGWRQLARLDGVQDGLQGALYRALAPARDGGFWLGGFNGMVERLHPDGSLEPLDEASLDRLRGVKLFSIAEDRDGRLWLGHRAGGLIRIGTDGVIDEWTRSDARDATPAGQIDQLQPAADGSLWLAATGGGVQQRDPASGRVLRDFPAGDASGLGSADIEALALAADGGVWVAGSDGVAALDPAATRFRAVPELGTGRVYALAFDGPEVLWLQRQTGLEQYRRRAGQWRREARVDATQGMPALGAAGLRVDARHRVWVSTSRGLLRWDPQARVLRRHGVQDDNGSQEYQDRALAMSAQGVLAAAAADGSVLLVDTAASEPAPTLPPLRFDRASVRRNGRWQDLPLGAALALGRDDREFRVGARLLAFDDPAANRYWSKLDGFDRDWVALGASGDRSFTGLAPGRYLLRVRARDAAGNPAREQRLAFAVPPPWWRTWWALCGFALLMLLTLCAAALAYRARLRRSHAWQLAEHKRALAEQASDAKSRFLATLGHEVRTPMTGVLGMSELLRGSRLDERQRGQVDAIHRAGEHLLRLVNDALDLARIEAGKLALSNGDFALRPLVDEVAELMAPVAERKGLVFVDALAADAPEGLHGDRTRVQQILLNLLGNAIKFTENGHVSLEAEALAPQGVRFVVADTGPGLNREQQSRLFRRFEQAEGARTAARYGGSGLGLAISQELAAAMGGRIAVDSAPGRGTRFVVELPLAHAHAQVAGRPGLPDVPASGADALRLLLVEDDPIVAEVMQGLLRAQGHAVTHVAHGLAALSEMAAQPVDAALLDLDLPGMDGLALARMLRAQGIRVPLLAVTARSDAEAEAQARAAGFDGFLRKPVTGAMLAQALEALRASME